MRILTVNRHHAYIRQLIKIGFEWDIVEKFRGEDLTWGFKERDLGQDIRLCQDEWREHMATYDVVIAHTLADALYFSWYYRGMPLIYIAHIALYRHGLKWWLRHLLKRLCLLWIKARTPVSFVAVSPWKAESWGFRKCILTPPEWLRGAEVDWGISEKRAVVVGNRLDERVEVRFELYLHLAQHVPVQLIGLHPRRSEATSFASRPEYYEALSRCHVYVFILEYPWEDGYNLSMLEAMSLGMPVVSMRHPRSLIVDGVHGFLCDTPAQMVERVKHLLAHPEQARTMGRAARELVREQFDEAAFTRQWRLLLQAAARKA